MVAEHYSSYDGTICRTIDTPYFSSAVVVENRADPEFGSAAAWWQSFLRGAPVISLANAPSELRIVDAFCGCGGLSLGVSLAAIASGHRPIVNAAIDMDPVALASYEQNLHPKVAINTNVDGLVDFHVLGSGITSRFAYPPEITEPSLSEYVNATDLFLAGPPCEGHSNFNNKTRRDDPRNRLYLSAVALGVALGARAIVIENVPDVVAAKGSVVEAAKSLLTSCNYSFLSSDILAAHELGGAQTRRRFFLIATKNSLGIPLSEFKAAFRTEPYPISWAISDLLNIREKMEIFDDTPVMSVENQKRIEWLFENDKYNLADTERPDCHKNGHTYPSVYGRLWWNKPAQTITTGFLTPGRGRFIHPLRPRVLTPHEAARVQSFPDSYRFSQNGSSINRTQITKLIGDAVPPVLGFAAGLAAITNLHCN